jgi:dipeptidase E
VTARLPAGKLLPHYDVEPERRPTYQRLVAEGLPPGIAADDGVGVHFVGAKLADVVTERPGADAYRVEPAAAGVREIPLRARVLPSVEEGT